MQITDEIRAKNLYEVLGLKTNTASREEIAKAYRTLAMKFHPDKNPGDQAAATKFKEMNEAYEILGSADPAVRDQYDRSSPHGSHYSEDAEEEQGSFAAYASFFAQMRFLMLINLLNIFTWSPQPNPFTPMPKNQLPPQNTGLKVGEGHSLQDIHQLLSQWIKETGKEDQGYSSKLQTQAGEEWIVIQAPTQEGLDEIQEFLESGHLIESIAKKDKVEEDLASSSGVSI